MLVENEEKITPTTAPQINKDKKPIESDAYYTIPEISDRRSPWYVASASTIFRAIRNGGLVPCYPEDRKRTLLSGAAIHAWLRGEKGKVA